MVIMLAWVAVWVIIKPHISYQAIPNLTEIWLSHQSVLYVRKK
jgi:hypothetical protein